MARTPKAQPSSMESASTAFQGREPETVAPAALALGVALDRPAPRSAFVSGPCTLALGVWSPSTISGSSICSTQLQTAQQSIWEAARRCPLKTSKATPSAARRQTSVPSSTAKTPSRRRERTRSRRNWGFTGSRVGPDFRLIGGLRRAAPRRSGSRSRFPVRSRWLLSDYRRLVGGPPRLRARLTWRATRSGACAIAKRYSFGDGWSGDSTAASSS